MYVFYVLSKVHVLSYEIKYVSISTEVVRKEVSKEVLPEVRMFFLILLHLCIPLIRAAFKDIILAAVCVINIFLQEIWDSKLDFLGFGS